MNEWDEVAKASGVIEGNVMAGRIRIDRDEPDSPHTLPSQITNLMKGLEVAREEMMERLEMLERCLSPVLAPDPTGSNKAMPAEGRVETAPRTEVDGLIRQAERAVGRLQDVAVRIRLLTDRVVV